VVVAQSLAGLTAPLVCDRVPVDLLVMVAAMVPSPGEPPGDWWANTGHEQARREQDERDGRTTGEGFDVMATFFHDVPPDVVAEAMARGERRQSGTPFLKPWPLQAWPRRADPIPALSQRPLLPGGVHAPGREPAIGHHTRRDGQRPSARPQPPDGAGRPPRGVPRRESVMNRRTATSAQTISTMPKGQVPATKA
jgi:hypothetical protein